MFKARGSKRRVHCQARTAFRATTCVNCQNSRQVWLNYKSDGVRRCGGCARLPGGGRSPRQQEAARKESSASLPCVPWRRSGWVPTPEADRLEGLLHCHLHATRLEASAQSQDSCQPVSVAAAEQVAPVELASGCTGSEVGDSACAAKLATSSPRAPALPCPGTCSLAVSEARRGAFSSFKLWQRKRTMWAVRLNLEGAPRGTWPTELSNRPPCVHGPRMS